MGTDINKQSHEALTVPKTSAITSAYCHETKEHSWTSTPEKTG